MRTQGDRPPTLLGNAARATLSRWKAGGPLVHLVRALAGIILAGLGVYLVSSQRGELAGVTTYLAHLRWTWVVLAVAAEVASMVAFGGMQKTLLAGGGVRMGWVSIFL